jgi:diadenylate cyclase
MVDILLVAFLIYQALRLVRETRAVQLLKGIILLVLLYGVTSYFELRAFTFLLQYVFTVGAWALLVIFQPELRRALDRMGRTRFTNWVFNFSGNTDDESLQWNPAIQAIGEAAIFLSKRRIGALMVLERQTKLGEVVKSGTIVDSAPSAELIGNIFFPNSPLHDGALVIRQGRLYAAGCFLPLSDNYDISKEMGTRHRAGLGMSEQSDAIVVIVSEETGTITIANDGKLMRGYTGEQLTKELEKALLSENREEKTERKMSFIKVKK